MIIGQIPDGSPIEITITSGEKKAILSTVSRSSSNTTDTKLIHNFQKKYRYASATLADVIEKNGKYVGFHTESSASSIIVSSVVDQKPYQWKDARIITAVFKKQVYHLIMSNQDVRECNRRGSFRQWVGSQGTLKIGLAPGSRDVLVKDLSTSGIGLIVDPLPDRSTPKIGDVVLINFTDNIGGSGSSREFSFNLKATVCRTAEETRGRTILGCKFAGSNESVSAYINMKQTAHKNNSRA